MLNNLIGIQDMKCDILFNDKKEKLSANNLILATNVLFQM